MQSGKSAMAMQVVDNEFIKSIKPVQLEAIYSNDKMNQQLLDTSIGYADDFFLQSIVYQKSEMISQIQNFESIFEKEDKDTLSEKEKTDALKNFERQARSVVGARGDGAPSEILFVRFKKICAHSEKIAMS